MPEFQASHFFILKILQCRIFTAFLIGIANLFRNYLLYSYCIVFAQNYQCIVYIFFIYLTLWILQFHFIKLIIFCVTKKISGIFIYRHTRYLFPSITLFVYPRHLRHPQICASIRLQFFVFCLPERRSSLRHYRADSVFLLP